VVVWGSRFGGEAWQLSPYLRRTTKKDRSLRLFPFGQKKTSSGGSKKVGLKSPVGHLTKQRGARNLTGPGGELASNRGTERYG